MVRSAAFMGRKDRSDKVLNHAVFATLYRIENRRFALWLPVALGVGVWAYFHPVEEPDWRWAFAGLAPLGLVVTGLARRAGWGALALCWLAATGFLGFGAAAGSAHRANAPAIAWPMGETVEGRIIGLSRSASGAPRILLDRVMIYGVEPEATPARIRLTLLDTDLETLPIPGTRVRVYATLMPAVEPVEPGAFDFRRRAFFQRLGGVGLTRGHLLVVPSTRESSLFDRLSVGLANLRDSISRHLRTVLPGRQGAFAAAIIVGDRADIAEPDAEALRASNLAHLLAISGLHMGMLTGLVYGLARLLFALVPFTSYRISTKKAAALVALTAGAGYLALSGATVATQRAYIMVAFALLAVLVDRPAITLRALALAAAVILLIRPISLLDAGFQMSFAATIALVAGYEAMRARGPNRADRPIWQVIPRLLALYVIGILISSLLAGGATAPFAAFHFNRTAPYGLVSNLLALPVMGVWIAPWACLAGVLAPFGLADPALRAMGAGIEVVLMTAHWVASLPGAVQPVRAAPPIVLGLIAMGGLWLALWRGPWRFGGIVAIAMGLFVWSNAPPRPDVLIAPGGRLVGVLGPDGRTLDHARAQSFAAKTWLRRDGDGADQAEAARRPGLTRGRGRLSADLAHDWRLEVLWKKRRRPGLAASLCTKRTILIDRHGQGQSGPCLYYGLRELKRSGAIAITLGQSGPQITTSRRPGRGRLWERRRQLRR